MTRTYIYGIPQGFNLYEGEPEMIEYFKSYYIADRRGRRLEINRRENGETFYNYIQYGLAEVSRTPQNAFFGMTLVLEGGHYITDLKTLLAFMDLLFNKLVERGTILFHDANNVLRYKIDRFDRLSDEVNWIKGNLPNILKRVDTHTYDSSFTQGEAGRIATFKTDASEGQMLAAFRKYNWVSICANIAERETGAASEPDVELNIAYLVSWLNNTNQKVVPIAINPRPSSIAELMEWRNDAKKHLEIIAQQMAKLKSGVVYENLHTLGTDIARLCAQLEVLIGKMTNVESKSEVQATRNCLNCQRSLPLSAFSTPDAIICHECENKKRIEQDSVKSGKSNNKKGTSVSLPPPPRPTPHLPKWLLPGLAAVVLMVLGILFIPKSCSIKSGEVKGGEPPVEKNTVNSEALTNALSRHDFNEVYNQLKDKDDKEGYVKQVNDTIVNYMWSCVDNNKRNDISQFWSGKNLDLLRMLGLNDKIESEKKAWINFIDDYRKIKNALNGNKITQEEYNTLCSLIDKNATIIDKKDTSLKEQWKKKIKEKIDDGKVVARKEFAKSFRVHYTNEYNIEKDSLVTGGNSNDIRDVLEYTKVKIYAVDGVFQGGENNGKETCEIQMEKAGNGKDVCGNKNIRIYLRAAKRKY